MTLSPFSKNLGLAVLLCAALGVSGCKTVSELYRHEKAQRLAVPANLLKRQVEAGPFSIAVFERVRSKGEAATIYIEGDGDVKAMGEKHMVGNVTPDYPLALHLATRDLGDNVIYVARPCQFEGQEIENGPCSTKKYAGPERFSFETMEAMNTVLDKLKNHYGFTGFNLVGYDGGGTVATLLAAKRKDVISLRTVAANLDTDLNSANHKQPEMIGSLNPRDFAKDIAMIPQHHFIGEWDQDIQPNLSASFRSAMGHSTCTRISTVAEVDHEGGWANRWPTLLQEPLDCNAQ